MAKFAVVVPTRNRPDALRMTLLGLGASTHGETDYIVSDNSDPEYVGMNQKIVSETLSGKSYRYLQPDRVLNMVSHWNFAVSAVDGADYVGFVTDRMTLLPAAIGICDEIVRRTGTESVCYLNGVVSLTNGTDLPPIPQRVLAEERQSSSVLADFARAHLRKDSPRFLNSFTSRGAILRIKERYGEVFGGISPDYAFTFRFLDVVEIYQFVASPLLIDHSPQISNGMAVTRNIGNKAAKDFIRKISTEQASEFLVGPLPNEITLLPSVILREMEICRDIRLGVSQFPPIHAQSFYSACGRAVRRSIRIFDVTSRQTSESLERFRLANKLSRWPFRVRLSVVSAALRNTIRGWAGQFMGAESALPGVTRGVEGDAQLLRNLKGVALALAEDDTAPAGGASGWGTAT